MARKKKLNPSTLWFQWNALTFLHFLLTLKYQIPIQVGFIPRKKKKKYKHAYSGYKFFWDSWCISLIKTPNTYRGETLAALCMLAVNTTHFTQNMCYLLSGHEISTFIPKAVRIFCSTLLLCDICLYKERKIDFFWHIC